MRLEPAVFAKPLLFGPYMHHFPELAVLLQQAGGAVQVQGRRSCTSAWYTCSPIRRQAVRWANVP